MECSVKPVASRKHRENPPSLVRRATPAVVIAAVLAGAALVPSASADTTSDQAIVADYAGDGDITSCAFSKAQLQSADSQITPDIDSYSPDFRIEVEREIARWTSGACGSGSGGQNGGQNGGGQNAGSRATIKSVKVAKNRRSAKVKLSCPAAVVAGCHVTLSGKLAGKTAAKRKSANVASGASKTVKMKLKSSARKRLLSKGGRLKISAKTAGSTLGSASRTAKIAAPGA
jgi:hypothetical protein